MTQKIDPRIFNKLTASRSEKITVYMSPAHKWMIEEIAHEQRVPQKKVLFDILQKYWECEVNNTK